MYNGKKPNIQLSDVDKHTQKIEKKNKCDL